MKKIAIHGLGYVGLTAAVHWAKAGWTVLAHDRDHKVIDALRKGMPRAGEFLSYLDADVGHLVEEGKILPTHTLGDTFEARVHSIAVPTEKDGEPWDEAVLPLLHMLAVGLTADKDAADAGMILIESTLTPGTIEKFLTEHDSGLLPHIAVCPRRDWFADPTRNLETCDRVVGGLTPVAGQRAAQLLAEVTTAQIDVCTAEEAELVKPFENALLHGMIAMASELAMCRPDVDISKVVKLASGHWRLPTIYLGAGAGGRCVPLGTKYIEAALGACGELFAEITETERELRLSIASAILRRIRSTSIKMPNGETVRTRKARVLILGIAYRPNFRDAGLSPGLEVARHLHAAGVEVLVHDPMWSADELRALTGFQVFEGHVVDALFLATPHKEYLGAPWVPDGELQFVLDAQGTWEKDADVYSLLKTEYRRIGGADWR